MPGEPDPPTSQPAREANESGVKTMPRHHEVPMPRFPVSAQQQSATDAQTFSSFASGEALQTHLFPSATRSELAENDDAVDEPCQQHSACQDVSLSLSPVSSDYPTILMPTAISLKKAPYHGRSSKGCREKPATRPDRVARHEERARQSRDDPHEAD